MSTDVSTVYTYQLNGVTTDFNIPFDYLSRKFVKVTLLGKERKVLNFMTDYRFLRPTTIRTTRTWGPSDGYDYIEIRRNTSAKDLIVDFSDGSILRAGDLNTANLQAMHIAEEARSIAADSLSVNEDGNLDARFRKIVNLGDPVNRKDAVTKAYVDDAKDGVIANKEETKRYRDEALKYRNAAEGFDNSAEQQANLAGKYASDTRIYGNSVNGLVNNAQGLVDEVKAEGVIAHGYVQATSQNAQAAADNTKVTTLNAQLTQQNKEQCAGHEAATKVYEESARAAQVEAKKSQTVSEEASKMAKQSEAKALDSKTKAEAARDLAIQNSKNSDAFAKSADESAKAAAASASSAQTSAGNAGTQAGQAQSSASQALSAANRAEAAASKVELTGTMRKPKRLQREDTLNGLLDGLYYMSQDGSVEESRPVPKAGTLEVGGDGYLQRFYTWNKPECWWRYVANKHGSSEGKQWTYSPWYRMDGMRPKALGNNNDLNTFKEDGFYTTYLNPVDGWQGLHFPEQRAGMLQVAKAWGGDGIFQVYTTYLGIIYVRWYQGGSWKDWNRQATKTEVDSKVGKSQLDTDGSLTTSTTEVPTMYTLAKIARKGFTTKWTGTSSDRIEINGLVSTYGLEVFIKAEHYTYRFEFPYADSYAVYVGWYDPKNDKYFELRQSSTGFTVIPNGGLKIQSIAIRENFVGSPI